MNKQERKLLMERIIVLVNGIAGAVVGFCIGFLSLILCMVLDYVPQTILGAYLLLFGPETIGVILGFYLAVRKDWWIMKRRW